MLARCLSRRTIPRRLQYRTLSSKVSTPAQALITPGSEHHHDLPTFLAYSDRVGLSSDTAVFVGTHYEYTVASSLRRLGFSLTRTGRTHDLGIDLVGQWGLPNEHGKQIWRVIAQCKARSRKVGPETVRELEGAFAGVPARFGSVQGDAMIGILVGAKPATKGVREALGRSRWPLGYMMVGLEGTVSQFLWNEAARAVGLEGWGVGVRYLTGEKNEEGEVGKEIVLTWKGKEWHADPD